MAAGGIQGRVADERPSLAGWVCQTSHHFCDLVGVGQLIPRAFRRSRGEALCEGRNPFGSSRAALLMNQYAVLEGKTLALVAHSGWDQVRAIVRVLVRSDLSPALCAGYISRGVEIQYCVHWRSGSIRRITVSVRADDAVVTH